MTIGSEFLALSCSRPDPVQGASAEPARAAAPARRRPVPQDWMLYQPRLALQGGRLHGIEAATRSPPVQTGRDMGRGPLGEWEIAGSSGRARLVASWRLDAAFAEIAGWCDTRARLCVAVPAELMPQTLLSVLTKLGCDRAPCERLELDCPEAWLGALDLDGVLALSAISDLGVDIAVEDFGESAASLGLLRRLPLGVVRLHASLARDLERGVEDRAVLRAIVAAAHAIGMRVAASGVDTLRQRDLLAELGCDDGVGTALSPPIPSRELQCWLGADPPEPNDGWHGGSVAGADRRTLAPREVMGSISRRS